MKNITNLRRPYLPLFSVLLCLFVSNTLHAAYEDCGFPDEPYPLHSAIKADNQKAVLCLLKAGYDPNSLWENGLSALSLSVGQNLEITKLLIEYGSDVNIHNGKAMAYAFSELGTVFVKRNSGDEDFLDDSLLPFEKLQTLAEKVTASAQTVYALLDAGADYSLAIKAQKDPSFGSSLLGFATDICRSDLQDFYRYEDYAVYLDEIAKRAKYKIRFTHEDKEGLKKLTFVGSFGSYEVKCMEYFSLNFGSQI